MALFFSFALLFSGCDALKSLYGEIYGEDDGSDGGGIGDGGGGGTGGDSGIGGGGGGGSGGSIRGVSVSFEGVTVDGNGTTTLVSLVFNRDIPGLSENDITVIDPDGKTGAVKGVLAPTGREGIYTLGIAGVKAAGEITVMAGKNGYTFSPASRPAELYYDPVAIPVTFAYAIANGAADSQTTTALTLAFNQAIPGLGADDITLAAGSTGAVKGNLAGAGGVYTLGLGSVRAAGNVIVTAGKSGWTINPSTIAVPVYYYPVPLATGGTTTFTPVEDNPSQIWEIHTFTADDTLEFIAGTPPSNLTAQVLVVAGGGGGGMSAEDPVNFRAAGGGGAGGYIYLPSYAISGNSITVKVGAGGVKSIADSRSSPGYTVKDAYIGGKGGDSELGSIKAPGGGGGASHYPNRYNDGLPGGSGGGGTAVQGVGGSVENGTISSAGDTPMGSAGGGYMAGGGGGAGGTGTDGTDGTGGPGTTSSISGQAVTYARGGDAARSGVPGVDGGANTGNGGSGGSGTGGKGGSGIVVIRFQRSN